MRKIIDTYTPIWGAAVMGTGVLSIVTASIGGAFVVAGAVLFWIATATLAYALPCWLAMWFVPSKVRQVTRSAGMLVFVPTVPVGVIVWANNLMALRISFFPRLDPSIPAILWIVSSVVIVALAVHFIDRIFASASIQIQESTFGWLIPPVALLIIPLGAPQFLGAFSAATAHAVIIVSFALWGAGFLAYVFVNAAITHRYFFHEMPMNQMTPSVWVGLGPIGAGAAGLISLSRAAANFPDLGYLAGFGSAFALLLWGFGVIWYCVSLVLTFRKAFFEKIPYTMGWWAFTFPLGAYALSTRALFAQTGAGALSVVFWILFVNLVAFWLITVWRTGAFLIKGPGVPRA